MIQQVRRDRKVPKAAVGCGVLMALAVGVSACGGGVTPARRTAAASPSAATATVDAPGRPSAPTSAAPSLSDPATTLPSTAPGPSVPTPSGSVPSAPVTSSSGPVASAPGTTKVPAPTTATTTATAGPSTTVAVVPTPMTNPPPALVPRRQPTAAEINQVISAVHAQLPIYNPTGAEIAIAGDQVCTAFDHGQTFTQVKVSLLQSLGGAYSSLIPASVPDTAVRTLVAMYCPGYGSKLV